MNNHHGGHIKNHEYELAAVYRIADLVIIFSSLYLFCSYRQIEFDTSYQLLAACFSGIFLLFGESVNLYRSWRVSSRLEQSRATWLVWLSTACALFVLAYFLKVSETYSRVVVGSWFIVTPFILVIWRFIFRRFLALFRTFGYNTRQAIIVGLTENGIRLKKELNTHPELGINFTGFYDDRAAERLPGYDEHGLEGTVDKALEMAKNGEVDHVYIALPMEGKTRIAQYLNELSNTTATTFLVPDFFIYDLLHSRWNTLGNIQTISVFDTPFQGSSVIIKRLQDIILSSIILLLISPLLVCIAIGVKLTSPGPIIFKQDRYGLDCKRIRVWKFRSMTTQDNGDVVKQATKGDARITKLGAFLRRTSLDELPQFYNVLQGKMSIVGPRPHAVAHNEEYREIVNRYMLRHKVKPGITGWAQINGYRGETDTLDKMEKRIEYDLAYIQSWTLLLDLKIVFLTIFKGFVSKTAY